MLQILKIIKILNSDANPAAIASAVCLAMVIGLTPVASPHNILVVFCVLLFRVHLGSFIMAAILFKFVGFALQSQLEAFGLSLLQNPGLESFWTALYNTQFGRLSFFNYSTTMGGLFIALVSFIPLWLISVFLINQYRGHLMSWVQKNKVIQVLKGSALIRLYNKSNGGS